MRLLVLKVSSWRGGIESEEGIFWHAVEERNALPGGPALCGAHPVRGWSWQVDFAVTCPTCLRIKAMMG